MTLTSEDREWVQALSDSVKAMAPVLDTLADQSRQAMVANEVTALVLGALISEVAELGRDPVLTLDRILAQATAIVEANPDSEGRALSVVDKIRKAAEAYSTRG